jgi:DNA-binding response OmpR family regulator
VRRSGAVAPKITPMTRLLMIDDDTRLSAMVRDYLAGHGLEVVTAADAAAGLRVLDDGGIQLLILDLMLPDADGLELCRRIRARPAPTAVMPILMLTAKGDPLDRVIGLEIGADDYLPKPFEPRELLARIRALLRRGGAVSSGNELAFGRLVIDRAARVVRIDSEPRQLTSYQFDLLAAMAARAGRVLSREQLLDALSHHAGDAFDRSIDVHIARIRAAIEDDPKQPRRIITVRGAGYVFARDAD